jgi:subtilisin family serine protease
VRRAALTACALALLVPGTAWAGRYAVGVEPGTSLNELAAVIESRTGAEVTSGDVALRALFVDAKTARGLAGLSGTSYVERLDGAERQLAFTPNDPLLTRQWYLSQIHAFDYWPQVPTLTGVLVAVLDSGIDGGHPEFKNRILDAKSFIGGSPYDDKRGHGTFVAGIVGAATGNGVGIAGVAFPGQLLVAKIAKPDGSVPLDAEARAIRWAVDNGARVINLSLAGVRDPFRPGRDTYSLLEASAVAYARRHGTLVVAAVGNSDQAPRSPWNYAGYPAALPHVLGVSAIARDGSVPTFSNRDAIYNDLTAPGDDIYSTIPRALPGSRPTCANVGYSDCGPPEYRRAEGTSFAAPQAAGAAALLWALRPGLAPNQVATLLERSAQDMTQATGCKACPALRDRFTGWGRLDLSAAVEAAATGEFPKPDRNEANDDAGGHAWTLKWRRGTLTATVDFWDDQSDVYRIKLGQGRRFTATLRGPSGADLDLLLWKPGTRSVEGLARKKRQVAAQSLGPGSRKRIAQYRVRKAGDYYLEVHIAEPGAGSYSLSIAKR